MDRLIRSLFSLPPDPSAEAGSDEEPTSGRLILADVSAVVREINQRHACAPGPAAVMAQATVALALLSAMIKGDERITLQIVCNGPVGRAMVESTGEGTLRGFPRDGGATVAGATLEARARAALGTAGDVHVMRSLVGRTLYQGASPLSRGGVAASVEGYLEQSEQVASAVILAVGAEADGTITRARGMLIQALGGGDRRRFASFLAGLDRPALARWLETAPLDADPAPLTPLIRDLERMGERPLTFACLCSAERAAGGLMALGAEDLRALKAERGAAEVDCAFCRTVYRFDGAALDQLIEQAAASDPVDDPH